jgi:hypothetical protein
VPDSSIVLGLDLGRQRDFAALVALRCEGARARLTGVKRWPLRTSYPRVLEDLRAVVEASPERPALAVDATGVGVGFVDFLRREQLAALVVPVSITSGQRERQVDGVFRVPKQNIMRAVSSHLRERLLTVAPDLPGAADLARELRNVEVRHTQAGNEVSGAFRHNTHDDLVLALAVAVWLVRRRGGLT